MAAAVHTGTVRSWKQLVFPGVFLIYLVQTADGVFKHSSGFGVVIGLLLVPAFCACYLAAMVVGRNRLGPRAFWYCYAACWPSPPWRRCSPHQDAFVMLVYVSVMTVAAGWLRGILVIVGYCLIATFVPMWIWHTKLDLSTAARSPSSPWPCSASSRCIRSNAALAQARSEVARLATENERARIARDLHDLLGHSLTTITVKAQLAHRLSATDPARAAVEIGEVEDLTRRTLADVRAAVSGYREVTLGNELAAAREVLRAAGITARLPGAIDSVAPAGRRAVRLGGPRGGDERGPAFPGPHLPGGPGRALDRDQRRRFRGRAPAAPATGFQVCGKGYPRPAGCSSRARSESSRGAGGCGSSWEAAA